MSETKQQNECVQFCDKMFEKNCQTNLRNTPNIDLVTNKDECVRSCRSNNNKDLWKCFIDNFKDKHIPRYLPNDMYCQSILSSDLCQSTMNSTKKSTCQNLCLTYVACDKDGFNPKNTEICTDQCLKSKISTACARATDCNDINYFCKINYKNN